MILTGIDAAAKRLQAPELLRTDLANQAELGRYS
jgi:hypothetical protein